MQANDVTRESKTLTPNTDQKNQSMSRITKEFINKSDTSINASKIIDYQRHTVEFSSITPTRTTPPITSRTTPRRPDQPYHTNPDHTNRSQPAEPAETKPPPESSDPINFTGSTQVVKSKNQPAKPPSRKPSGNSSPLLQEGNPQKHKHSSNNRQIVPPTIPQQDHQDSHQPTPTRP